MQINDESNTTWKPNNGLDGEFKRKESQFRHWITVDGKSKNDVTEGFKAELNRYHLYVSLACPWAHRVLIFRQLKNLEKYISISVVHPDMTNDDWTFEHNASSKRLYSTTGDTLYNYDGLSEIYNKNNSYQGLVTVPVLWDKKQQCIVNNESSEIIRMFNSEFDHLTGNTLDFYPEKYRSQIDEVNKWVYSDINNGVYKTGFATTQDAYEKHCNKLFSGLDKVENILQSNRFLVGEMITEADWRLVTTLFRFDAVYHTHFKCNKQLISEYNNIYKYMLELYKHKGVAQTMHMVHTKRHYFNSHRSLNPHGIVAIGPQQDWG